MSKTSNKMKEDMQLKEKEVTSTKEIIIQVQGLEVIVLKNSNIFKVEGENRYLKQIVWDSVTDKVIEEITEHLQQK